MCGWRAEGERGQAAAEVVGRRPSYKSAHQTWPPDILRRIKSFSFPTAVYQTLDGILTKLPYGRLKIHVTRMKCVLLSITNVTLS